MVLGKLLFGLLVVFSASVKKSLGGVRFGYILADFWRRLGGPKAAPEPGREGHSVCKNIQFSANRAIVRVLLQEPIFSKFGHFWPLFGF